jgi:Fe-S oxidoreductase/FAD/FMN-containing dehydrogenase
MSAVSRTAEHLLKDACGEGRVRTDLRERSTYSFDIGAMPRLVKPFVAAGIAGAVVRPKDEDSVVRLIKLAAREGLKLVPRGWATSGYGGVLPTRGAVVVDVSGMQGVLSVDEDTLTVRVQAGAIWEEVDRAISKRGLALRLYPSSYRSSSVGGWLAQGGSGFGSFEYGSFKENVVGARVVTPTGEVKEFTGDDLSAHIADAEGITGIITEVAFRVRRLEPEVHRLIAFDTAGALGSALARISSRGLPIWSITFLNPESTRLKKRLPHSHGHPYEEAHELFKPDLPEAYLVVIAYPESRRDAIDAHLAGAISAAGGNELPQEAAEHEWEQRFAPMRLKRIGPSIIPTEVIVPLSELGSVLDEIDEKIGQPFVLEGMAAKGDRVVLLGFVPHDERSFAFNLAFALALSVIKIAKAHGGTAYSTGLYFRREAESVLGRERVAELARYKATVDPHGVMNPGKVLGRGLIDLILGTANAFEPLVRPLANVAKPPAGPGDLSRDVHGIPGDVAFMAYACARCGYCVHTCEQFSGRGWESQSPRGKYAFLRDVMAGKQKWDRKAIGTFLVCTTCEVCTTRCQLQLPVEHNWMEMRGKLINDEQRGTFPAFEMMAAALRAENDIWAFKAQNRDHWLPDDLRPKLKNEGELLYFAGCTASACTTDVPVATVRLLTDAGYDLAYMGTDEACCGIPMKIAGKWDLFEQIYVHNTTEARKRGAKTIVTSCPACALVWKELYPGVAAQRGEAYEFQVKHYSELVAEALVEGRLVFDHEVNAKVTFHDSCHIGRAQGIYEPPRDMLRAMPGVELVEMEHNREEGLCCGSVLTLVGEKPIAPILGGRRLQEALDIGAEKVVALCPCCQTQLRISADKNGMKIHITDLARFACEALGYEIEDKTEHTLYMWGFFDKFIDLLLPENMAEFMTRIFPQMLDAMPPGMKPMMLAMKHVPGGLAMMQKMMPLMFPRMAPSILSKVMPDMVEEVRDYIGEMPVDMDELMPDLLPKTMDALMPTYLPQLIPYLTPKFIEFLRTAA